MTELTSRQKQLMSGFSFPGEAKEEIKQPVLNERQAQLMKGFKVDNVLASPVEAKSTEIQLQDLLIRQAKGEEGLQAEINDLRGQTGQFDNSGDVDTEFVPQSSAGIGDKIGVGIRKIATGEDSQTRATTELPELAQAGVGNFLEGEDSASIAKFTGLAALTTNQKEIASIAKSIFPDLGVTVDEGQNYALFNPKNGQRVVINKPGFSGQDAVNLGAMGSAFAGGGVITEPLKLAAKDAAIQTGIETAQVSQGGEFNPTDIALTAAGSGLAQKALNSVKGEGAATVKQFANDVGSVTPNFVKQPLNQVKEAVSPTPQTDIEKVVKAATTKNNLALADVVQADSNVVKAADDLGVKEDLLSSTLSTNKSFKEVEQGLADAPFSALGAARDAETKKLGQVADDIITQFGGSQDKAGVYQNIQGKMHGVVRATADKEEAIYGSLKKNINPAIEVDTPVTRDYLVELLSTIKNDPSRLNPLEKSIYSAFFDAEGNYQAPTYAILDRLRKTVGAGLNKKQGEFKDGVSSELRNFYSMLRQDQDAALNDMSFIDQVKVANELTVKRKAIEDNMTELFGKNLEKELSSQLERGIQGLAKGEPKQFNRVMGAIPEKYRQEALMTALNSAFTGQSRAQKQLNISGFASWYRGVTRNSTSARMLAKALPKGAARRLNSLGIIVDAVNQGRQSKTSTGRIVEVQKRLNGAVSKFLGDVKKPAALEVVGSFVAGVPGIGWIAGSMGRGTDDMIKSMDEMLANKGFQDVMVAYAKGGKSAAKEIANKNKFFNGKLFGRYLKAIPATQAQKINDNGFPEWLEDEE